MQCTFTYLQITFEWDTHQKWTFSKSMWKSSSVKESICIGYSPPPPLNFPCWRTFLPDSYFSLTSFVPFIWQTLASFPSFFVEERTYATLYQRELLLNSLEEHVVCQELFCSLPFPEVCFYIQTLHYHFSKYNFKSV